MARNIYEAAQQLVAIGLTPLATTRIAGGRTLFFFDTNMTDQGHANLLAIGTTDPNYQISFMDDCTKHHTMSACVKLPSMAKAALASIRTVPLFINFIASKPEQIKKKLASPLHGLVDKMSAACNSHKQYGTLAPILLMSLKTNWNKTTSVTIVVSHVEYKIPLKAVLTLIGIPPVDIKFSAHETELDH